MFRNYFKTAWRNLLKNKFYSLINISGLTAGLAVGLLILLWVRDERSYDRFHTKGANIYRLENMVGTGASRQIWQSTAAPIGMLARKEIPVVKDFARMTNNPLYAQYKYGEKVFYGQRAQFTDPALFSIFDFKIVEGNADIPFPDDNSVVITKEAARRFFGNETALGKVITTDDKTNFKVTGVINDFPENSSIKADMLFPMSLWSKKMYEGRDGARNLDNDFNEYAYETYLLLDKGAPLRDLEVKLRDIHLRNKADDTDIAYLLQPLARMHLYNADGSNNGIETVRMFTIIALLILVIACINYVNLSTARSMLRAKEVSLRKIVGAERSQLFLQFIVETALLFLLATVLALGLMYVLLPFYNDISGKQLVIDLADPQFWGVIGLTITGTLLASSIYPALLLSSFEPLKAIKGKISSRIKDALFRKALVVTQFAFSVVLIAGTIIISKQLRYIQSRQLGYDKEHVFSLYMRDMRDHYDAVKAELLAQPGITGVTRASSNIVDMGGESGDNEWDGKEIGETMMVHPMAVEKDFIPFFKMQLQDGQNFTGTNADSMHFILNETAVRNARIKDPIGKPFRLWKTRGTIVGVVKDFHFASMKEKIAPAVFYYLPNNNGLLYIKTTGAKATAAIAAVKKEWDKYNAEFPFSYSFLDESFNNLYHNEQKTGLLINIFAVIAILISCLGLLGLAAYTAQVRTREIGVRKVLGASVSSVVGLLATDFIKLVMIAIVIAIPVAWYAMNAWLQDFAYKVSVGWTVFLAAGIVAILIAAVTISFQSVRAALANPVKSLRSE